MSIANVVTRGIGPGGSVAGIVTAGFLAAIPVVSGTYLVLSNAAILPDDTLYVRNDLAFSCVLSDNEGGAITSGSFVLRILDTSGNEVDGVTWPLALSHQGSGRWSCVIDAALLAEYGKSYVLELSGSSGQLDGYWKKTYPATHRAF